MAESYSLRGAKQTNYREKYPFYRGHIACVALFDNYITTLDDIDWAPITEDCFSFGMCLRPTKNRIFTVTGSIQLLGSIS